MKIDTQKKRCCRINPEERIQKKAGYYRSYWMRQDLPELRFRHGGMQARYHHQVYA